MKIWIKLNSSSYVTDRVYRDFNRADYIPIEVEEDIQDIAYGYYKYENNSLELDKTKKLQTVVMSEVAKEVGLYVEPYDAVVNTLIRKKYGLSQELSILRQSLTKPEEFKEYNDYCEYCKILAKTFLNENEWKASEEDFTQLILQVIHQEN